MNVTVARGSQATDGQILHDRMAAAAEEATALLRAMSNPSRLLILCRLAERDRSVGELETALDLAQAYVSQQLARLRAEGIVTATREGRVMRYRLADDRVEPIIRLLYEQYRLRA